MELDTQRYWLRRAGVDVPLRPKVFDLLIHLVRHCDRVVPREELFDVLWGETIVGPGSLSGLVNELRSALGESGGPDSSIRTVHARGYQFVARLEGRSGSPLETDSSSPPRPAVGTDGVAWSPELLDAVRRRIESLLPSEIRRIIEIEGFEPLSARSIGELTRAFSDTELGLRGADSVAETGETSGSVGSAHRPMRLARSRARRFESGGRS